MEFSEVGGFLAVGALLALIGRGVVSSVKARAGSPGWRGVFYVTQWAHPILAGAALGLISSLPAPVYVGDGTAGRVIWYALAGGMAPTCGRVITSVLEHVAARKDAATE